MMDGTGPGRNEYQGTYVIFDHHSGEELERLAIQDQMVTTAMGGVLPEQSDSAAFRRVLDIGCGSGNWLIETAKMYPEIKTLIGVDMNRHMVEYARQQAQTYQVTDRVEFHMMDALLILEFPADFFYVGKLGIRRRCSRVAR